MNSLHHVNESNTGTPPFIPLNLWKTIPREAQEFLRNKNNFCNNSTNNLTLNNTMIEECNEDNGSNESNDNNTNYDSILLKSIIGDA